MNVFAQVITVEPSVDIIRAPTFLPYETSFPFKDKGALCLSRLAESKRTSKANDVQLWLLRNARLYVLAKH